MKAMCAILEQEATESKLFEVEQVHWWGLRVHASFGAWLKMMG